jgi:hypothetical protein
MSAAVEPPPAVTAPAEAPVAPQEVEKTPEELRQEVRRRALANAQRAARAVRGRRGHARGGTWRLAGRGERLRSRRGKLLRVAWPAR